MNHVEDTDIYSLIFEKTKRGCAVLNKFLHNGKEYLICEHGNSDSVHCNQESCPLIKRVEYTEELEENQAI